MSKDFIGGVRYASREVEKLAAHFVGNEKSDGTRDSVVYEQGIGCERAGKMLLDLADLLEKSLAVKE